MTATLVRIRFHLASLAASLETDQDEEDENPEIAELRADVECALIDHFDPMLRTLLEASGSTRAKVLQAAIDIEGLKNRLRNLSASLPRSPQEDAMFDGEIPPDEPTDIRITLNAVVDDQLDLALGNLLRVAGPGM